jgi:hypothetical protein
LTVIYALLRVVSPLGLLQTSFIQAKRRVTSVPRGAKGLKRRSLNIFFERNGIQGWIVQK